MTNEAGDDPPVRRLAPNYLETQGARSVAALPVKREERAAPKRRRSCARADNLTAPRFVSGLWLPSHGVKGAGRVG